MTDLRNETRKNRWRLTPLLVLGVIFLLAGCQTANPRVAPTAYNVLEPLSAPRSKLPSRADRSAAVLTETALVSDPVSTQKALGHLKLTDPRLAPLGQDLANTTLDDPIAYREASRKLLAQGGLDPLLKKRLKENLDEDPIAAANQRIFDHRHTVFAHTFNAVTEPLGTSVFAGMAVAPYKLALSLAKWALTLFEMDPLTLPERQARVLRKHFLDAHPDAPQAQKVREQLSLSEVDFYETRRREFLRSAEVAMNQGRPRLARAYANQVQREVPEDGDSLALRRRANSKISHQRTLRQNSVQFAKALPQELNAEPERLASLPLDAHQDASLSWLALRRPAVVRHVSESLLLPRSDLETSAKALRDADSNGNLHDEADYIDAIAEHEAGNEDSSWRSFDTLARKDPGSSNMARHAAALVTDPWQNPYGSFLVERSRQRRDSTVWFLFGDTRVPRYKALPQAVGYVMATPRMVQSLAMSPLRNLLGTGGKKPDFEKGMSISAYRYLELHPDGAHREELVRWLYSYEEKNENWRAALRLADFQPGFDPEKRQELVENVGSVRLKGAGKIRRRDQRSMILRNLARDYPDSNAGQMAGKLARTEVEEAHAQTIRMSREFLYENPAISGPGGLGLRSQYLDHDLENGELHPLGVSFVGGRTVEFNFVDLDGNEDALPIRIQRPISEERLARSVAILEERSFHNARIDEDALVQPDARRDLYFERARLGLTEQPDLRAGAQSTFVYESMRERYGMVRGRESILPFDLVFQGSLGDLSLGAFPRWRAPKPTTDSFLYR